MRVSGAQLALLLASLVIAFATAGDLLLGTVETQRAVVDSTTVLLVVTGLAFLVALLAHEAGHALAGVLVGGSVDVLAAGPVVWYVDGGRRRLGLSRAPALWGGFVSIVPPAGSPEEGRRWLRLICAGGPVASLLLCVSGLAMPHLADGAPPVFLLFSAVLAPLSLGVFVASIVPGSALDGIGTDGASLLLLRRPLSEAEWQASRFLAAATARRPAAWDVAALAVLAAAREETAEGARVFTYYRALASGDVPGARAAADEGFRLASSEPVRLGWRWELAYLAARFDSDRETAAELLAGARTGRGAHPPGRLRARAALSIVSGSVASASREIRLLRRMLATPRPGLACGAEREFLEDLLRWRDEVGSRAEAEPAAYPAVAAPATFPP